MFSRRSSILIVSIMFIAFVGVLKANADTEANKAVVQRAYEEILNQRNLSLVDELYAADFVSHFPGMPDIQGGEGFKQFCAMIFVAFPDIHYAIEDTIAEGDKVVTRSTVLGTHQGEFMGVPPTGRRMMWTAIIIHRFENGKFVEDWLEADFLGMMQQLGTIPPMGDDYVWNEPSTVTGEPGDPEANKAMVIRHVEEAWNQQKLDVLEEHMNPDVVNQMPDLHVGLEAYKQVMTTYLNAFPDLHLTVEDLIAEGDKVAHRWLSSGTHQGELAGMPASGNHVTSSGITIYRFADGKIVDSWWVWDDLGMMQQLTPPEVPTEDYDNVFFMSLQSGLNMVSLPLKPITPDTARSFAEKLSATAVITIDEAQQKFVGFTLDAPDDGFQIEGGKGYVVNVPEGGMVAFTGAAWTNQPPVEASPSLAPNDGAWAFVVSGRLLDDSDDSIKKDGYLVTVRNTRTNAVTTDVVRSRYFAAAFADLNRKDVVQTGDRLELQVRNTAGEMVSDTLSYTVTADAIRHAYLPLTLKNIEIPHKSLLLQNYPNPFNPETWIPYQLRESAEVVIRIYNANGRLVRTLDFGQREAGFYLGRSRAAYWNGLNDSSEPVSSGLYFYQLQAGDFNATRRMVILK